MLSMTPRAWWARRASLEVGDFNLDARQEVRLENDQLIAFVRPAIGGHVYELDSRRTLTNVLATLDRRPEPYHGTIAAIAKGQVLDPGTRASIREGVVLKQEGLDRLLVYDRQPRKALVDHFYPLETTLDDLTGSQPLELGDFTTGTYLATIERRPEWVSLRMERPGRADGHLIRVRKTIRLEAGARNLDVHYELEDLPVGVPIRFGVEFNFAAMAGHAPDRYFSDAWGTRLGMLDSRLDVPHAEGLSVIDEWLDLKVGLLWSCPSSLWAFPIETVSQSEGGFERVFQSTAVIPHWVITADESRRWDVRFTWRFDATHAVAEVPPNGTTERRPIGSGAVG